MLRQVEVHRFYTIVYIGENYSFDALENAQRFAEKIIIETGQAVNIALTVRKTTACKDEISQGTLHRVQELKNLKDVKKLKDIKVTF